VPSNDLWRGVVSFYRASQIMDLSPERLRAIADRERIDGRLGFHVDDLIRLSAKLSAATRNPRRKARLRAAVSTFAAIRDEAAREAA
jgi:hypothetical protein